MLCSIRESAYQCYPRRIRISVIAQAQSEDPTLWWGGVLSGPIRPWGTSVARVGRLWQYFRVTALSSNDECDSLSVSIVPSLWPVSLCHRWPFGLAGRFAACFGFMGVFRRYLERHEIP